MSEKENLGTREVGAYALPSTYLQSTVKIVLGEQLKLSRII